MMKKVIWYTSTEKNTAVQAIESGATINACNIVIFAKQREAEAYAAKRDGKKRYTSKTLVGGVTAPEKF